MSDPGRRWVLVTGAGRRLGGALARHLAEDGWAVAIHAHRSITEAQQLARDIEKRGGEASGFVADLGWPDSGERLIDEVWKTCGRLDGLVLSAGGYGEDSWEDVSWEQWSAALTLGCWSPLAMVRRLAKRLSEVKRTGAVVALTDARAADRDRTHFSYWCSKTLLDRLVRVGALEWAPTLRLNAVAPGLVLPPEGLNTETRRRAIEVTPLGIGGSVEEVTAAVSWLLEAPAVTGEVIHIDGGRHLRRGIPAARTKPRKERRDAKR